MTPAKRRSTTRSKRSNRSRRATAPSSWPRRLILLILAAGLFAAGFFAGRSSVPTIGGMPMFMSETELPERGDVKNMARDKLEKEVSRLSRELENKDKQIGELMMQVEVLTAGSHSGE